jgi:hypothetical protein
MTPGPATSGWRCGWIPDRVSSQAIALGWRRAQGAGWLPSLGAGAAMGEDGSPGVRVVAGGADMVVRRWRSGGVCGGRMQRGSCGTSCCGTAAAPVGVKCVGFGGTAGSRFRGSVRDGLNGTVGAGFPVGSRFKGSVRNGLNGAVGAGFAVGSRFKGSVRNGLNRAGAAGFGAGSRFKGSVRNGLNGATGPGVGAPCDGRMAGARGPAARARGVGEVRPVGADGKNSRPRGSMMCLCGGAGLAGATGSGNANARG